MKITYDEAMTKVFADEGGYTNDAADPGGPTNWGITIADAKTYWKKTATAADVKAMPKSVAQDIYYKHYALSLNYDTLPAGVDYAVLDYGINSGVARAQRVLNQVQQTHKNPVEIINGIYDERLAFLKRLKTWPTFGRGWERRCVEGRKLALSLAQRYPTKLTTVPLIAPVALTGASAVYMWGETHPIYVALGILATAAATYLVFRKKS